MAAGTADPPAEIVAAVAGDDPTGIQPLEHRRHADDRLEGRAGRVRPRNRLVEQRVTLVVAPRAVDGAGHAGHEQVRVERRRRSHAQDVARPAVNGDRRAGILAEHLQRQILGVGVQREDHLLAGNRRLRAVLVLAPDAALGVDFHPMIAWRSPQLGVQRALQALTADAEARMVEDRRRLLAFFPHRLDVAVRDLGHIADRMGETAAEGIEANVVHRGQHARQFVHEQADAGELLPGEVRLHRDRRETWRRIDLANDTPTAFLGLGQQARDQIERGVQVGRGVPHDRDGEAGAIARHHDAVAVRDPAARRDLEPVIEPVGGRRRRIAPLVDQLQVRETGAENAKAQQAAAAQQEGAPQERALPLVDLAEIDLGPFAHRNLRSPSSKRSMSQLAAGNMSTVGRIWKNRAIRLGGLPAQRVTIR